jgi:acid stress-induced BolA-like protein IbaG/YrbA
VSPEALQTLLRERMPEADIEVSGDGYQYDIRVVSEAFEGLLPVKRQQSVYAVMSEEIQSGAVHAVRIHAYTPSQWQSKS